jgi:hypothetical protein
LPTWGLARIRKTPSLPQNLRALAELMSNASSHPSSTGRHSSRCSVVGTCSQDLVALAHDEAVRLRRAYGADKRRRSSLVCSPPACECSSATRPGTGVLRHRSLVSRLRRHGASSAPAGSTSHSQSRPCTAYQYRDCHACLSFARSPQSRSQLGQSLWTLQP